MRSVLAMTKALSDINRIRVLCALQGRELCVCQIQELLNLAHSTTSRHMTILAAAGLVDVRRDGRWAYYRHSQEEPPPGARELLQWVCREACASKVIVEDRDRLRAILKLQPEELIALQASGKSCCAPNHKKGIRKK